MKKIITFFFLTSCIFIVSALFVSAQEKTKLNICLREAIKKDPSAELSLLVRGNTAYIRDFIHAHGGVYKYGYGKMASIALSAKMVEQFSMNEWVERIEFSCSGG